MIGEAPLSHITYCPGWETKAEQDYLYALAQQLPAAAVIVEIGGEYGMSASIFSKGAPSARIYSIDIRYDGPVGAIHDSNLTDASLGQNVVRIAANSQIQDTVTVFQKRERAAIDLLFIDGDHSFQGALNDLTLWAPLVKPNGFMVLHDTAAETNTMPHMLHYDVSRALAVWYKTNGAQFAAAANVDTIASFQRIKD